MEKRSILQLILLGEGGNTRKILKKLDKAGLMETENLKLNILDENDSHLSKYMFIIEKKLVNIYLKSWCAEFSTKCSSIKNVLAKKRECIGIYSALTFIESWLKKRKLKNK